VRFWRLTVFRDGWIIGRGFNPVRSCRMHGSKQQADQQPYRW
jgi:hypothetical protein